MFDALFVALVVLYLIISAKVEQWCIIAMLGFKIQTPQKFLENPRIYDRTRSAIFLCAATTLYGTKSIPWYIGLIILLVAFFAAAWIGMRRAFEIYRQIWHEGLENAENPKERAWMIEESMKTNAELRARFFELRKSGI